MKFFYKSGLLSSKELYAKATYKRNHQIFKETSSVTFGLSLPIFPISVPIRI
ncbi:MAG: hypothetical protein H0X63_07570 [Flavobacteriales bacterium]|nr:hypothetical protein [Flavobacteriales bacterium]